MTTIAKEDCVHAAVVRSSGRYYSEWFQGKPEKPVKTIGCRCVILSR
jgi:hypothetical protein